MQKTVRAVDANRHFSNVLKQVSLGQEFVVISRGKPVAAITPIKKADNSILAARKMLFSRLSSQVTTGARNWTRDELYESEP